MSKIRRALSEEEVLKQLGIPDFRHLSKDTVMQFATMLPDMNPDVAKKALEQFPDFAKAVLHTMAECKGAVDKAVEEGGKDSERLHELYSTIMSALQNEMSKDDIPFEQKQYWLEQMKEVAQMAYGANREGNAFKVKALTILGGVAVFGMGAMATILGGNVNIGEFAGKVLKR